MVADPITRAPDPGHDPPLSERVRRNDELRLRGTGGVLVISAGVLRLGKPALMELLAALRRYDTLTPASDAEVDHSQGEVSWRGHRVRWRIAACDLARPRTPDPADTPVNTRMLTLMLADEP